MQASVVAVVLIAIVAIGAAFLINAQRLAAKQAEANEAEQRLAAEQAQADEAKQRLLAEQAQADEAKQRLAAEQAQANETKQRLAAEQAQANEAKQRLAAESLATEKSQLADEKANLARMEQTAREQAEQQLYYSQIYRAAGDLEAGRNGQASAVLASIPREQRQWEARYLERRAAGTPLTLRTNTFGVASVSFSLDGRHLVSGSSDGTVILWDCADREGNANASRP